MRKIYDWKNIDGYPYILAERIELADGGYAEAQRAAATYRAEKTPMAENGHCVRVERDDKALCYYIWVGPPRERGIRTLPGEEVKGRNRHVNRKLRVVA